MSNCRKRVQRTSKVHLILSSAVSEFVQGIKIKDCFYLLIFFAGGEGVHEV